VHAGWTNFRIFLGGLGWMDAYHRAIRKRIDQVVCDRLRGQFFFYAWQVLLRGVARKNRVIRVWQVLLRGSNVRSACLKE
jgi:hypothetical protein